MTALLRRLAAPSAATLAAVVVAVLAGCAGAPPQVPVAAAPPVLKPPPAPPALVIAHRGASALRPEHTLAAYKKAIEDGADLIEPDLVITRDGVLVARHENDISRTTNVAELPQFADRKKTKVVDGERLTGWFTEDFTLAELKTLRARERIPELRPANTRYNDKFDIPTFDEIVAAVGQATTRSGKPVGIYPELKHPSYFRGIGLPLEDALVAALRRPGYPHTAPVYIQSFESGALRNIRHQLGKTLPNVRLVQLLGSPGQRPADWRLAGDTRTFASMTTATGLREVASYADGIGPPKDSVIPSDGAGLGTPTALVGQAHAAGLFVHPYTFRPENHFLPRALQAGAANARNPDGMVREVQAFLDAGIDGFFTDDPALGRRAVDSHAAAPVPR
jgi:glycerophosphoryl diester phosphodiesterase